MTDRQMDKIALTKMRWKQ